MISIGLPEKGKELISHLNLNSGEDYLFVDPDNALYDALDLNSGVVETFFSPATPFAFLDRFTTPGGMKELNQVLSKWMQGGFYTPPKQSQAFNQGGTFVFDDKENLVLAHYDESTGAHAKVEDVMKIAMPVPALN
mmetsp:Transcript_422/g.602  ORF Transcript_422/g.602 Transcript_422/m.602 type:complete len:136 (-) Transcript_422:78-485(-)|eukprot:CAMPEP_0194221794 /NCGR_PEP_ID=MMETSP0156-20130528/31370_1 /TAXON_ID=33649 /ORGANISM="Thalassionema nitzschioides, Strain L26-B" /LENGTH=135 /DNA_ID=CAMNT_0038952325 /DNA_START=428 /DNA_END=835 /DNA_ORIENTATION=+